ncbi:MAG: DUF309 domain-containing protein [Pseudomonadota bacterium]
MAEPPLPAHRHTPGRNERHEEGAFDWIRDQAPAETTSAGAADNPAWAYGLRLFNAGFYWEAHEVLEPVWMNAAPNAPERALSQAVIQLANAALKREMGRPRAALRLCDIAEAHAREAGEGPVMGLDPAAVRGAARRLGSSVAAGGDATAMELFMEL